MRPWLQFAIVALGGLLAAAPSNAVMCGEVITDKQIMTADLACGVSPGLTIGEGGALDMDGYKLTCMGTTAGIVLNGEGAKLSNGVITGCSGAGVSANAGKHKIERVLVSNCSTGFGIGSVGNKVKACAALNNSGTGFGIAGTANSLSGIVIRSTVGAGITGTGTGFKISDVSIAVGPTASGITLNGDGHKISKVRISGAYNGFTLSGSFNKISEVTSLKHVFRGIYFAGNNNQMKKCVASADGTADTGIGYGGGVDTSISGCRSLGSKYGIIFSGTRIVVSKNRVFGSAIYGISAGGSSSVIKGNIVVGSGTTDLIDIAPACANGDIWSKNVGTRTDSCIE